MHINIVTIIVDAETLEQMIKRVMEDKLDKQIKEMKSIIISNITVEKAEMKKRLKGEIESGIDRELLGKGNCVEIKNVAELVKRTCEMEQTIKISEKV